MRVAEVSENRRWMGILGLMVVMGVNIFLGLEPCLAGFELSLKTQAGLMLADWIWPISLLPKMEWQKWHDVWAVAWLFLALLESVGFGWALMVFEGQVWQEAVFLSAAVFLLRGFGVYLMRK